jgi:hypothetical protein
MQYYSLVSQQDEIEVDMALHKPIGDMEISVIRSPSM